MAPIEMRIGYATPAKQDLIEIQDFIARDNPRVAFEVVQRIRDQVALLASPPRLGRPGRLSGTRELSISRTPFFVVYRVQRRRVEVLAVIHGRRQWPP
jgi:toxin ParE1/3/4